MNSTRLKNLCKEYKYFGMNHYCEGYKLHVMRNITKRDMVVLCDLLKTEFDRIYNTTEFQFEPEKRAEGGIEFINFPGKTPDMYKDVRFLQCGVSWDPKKQLSRFWPQIIPPDVSTAWKEDESVIFKHPFKMSTTLQALRGAPSFTKTELEIFERCFNQVGFECKGKYPTNKALTAFRR